MFGAGSGDPLQREPGGVLTMFPLVASPSSPPNVMTGDMQAQYRKRTDATHCRLTASFTSLHRNGTFLLTSFTRPPKILQEVPVSSPPKHVRRSPERRSPARPLELWPRVMLRLLHRLRVVGGAVRLCRDLPLLLRKRTGVCFQHRCAGRVQVRPGSPETGRSWGVRCGCWGPTPLEAARSPDPETRRSRTGGRSGPWPCTPRHGRSGTQEKGVKRRQQGVRRRGGAPQVQSEPSIGSSLFSPHPSSAWRWTARSRGTADLSQTGPAAGKETWTRRRSVSTCWGAELKGGAPRSPGGHGDLGEAGQQQGGGQADEGDDGMLQEVHLPHQDVGGFGPRRDLLHEVHVHLEDEQTSLRTSQSHQQNPQL